MKDHQLESQFTLKYECPCGVWVPETWSRCRKCGEPNPDYEPHSGFGHFVVSQKSVIENMERKRLKYEDDLTEDEKDGIHSS